MPKKRTRAASTRTSQSRERNENGLTVAEQRFCDAYLADPDRCAKRAYQTANPRVKPSSANVQGCKILQRPHVADYIKAREAERRQVAEAEFDLSERNTLAVLRDMAFFDPADLFDDDGNLLSIKDMPLAARRAIAGFDLDVKQNKDGDVVFATRKVKFSERGASIDRAMRHLGLFEKDNRQRAPAEEVERKLLGLLDELGA